jgi:IPT/TIG domain
MNRGKSILSSRIIQQLYCCIRSDRSAYDFYIVNVNTCIVKLNSSKNQSGFWKWILVFLVSGVAALLISLAFTGSGITISAAGNHSYFLGEEINFSGTNTVTPTTYLFITGPHLPTNGAQIFQLDTKNFPVVNNNATTFQAADVLGDHTWSWKWKTSNFALDAGNYTIYAVSGPEAKDALGNVAYGTVSIIIKKPFVTRWGSNYVRDTNMGIPVQLPAQDARQRESTLVANPLRNICVNWNLSCNSLQHMTKDTNPSLMNGLSLSTSPQIIQAIKPDIPMNTVSMKSPNFSPAVVKPGDSVSIDLKIGDNKNNISINSHVTLLAGQTTTSDYSSVFPGTSDQSPGSRIFALFSDEYNAISSGLVGMKPGEQKNISVHFKDKIETKTMSSEYLKRYKINASNLSAGKLFVGTYTTPNSSTKSTVIGKIVSATRDYAVVDYSYPDIQVTILQIDNSSVNTTPVTYPVPTIKKVSPVSGSTSGGTLVTITGTNLSSIQGINFGKSRINSIRNVSDTTITAMTPPSEQGVVSIFFQAPQWLGSYDGFTFIESPANTNTTKTVKASY